MKLPFQWGNTHTHPKPTNSSKYIVCQRVTSVRDKNKEKKDDRSGSLWVIFGGKVFRKCLIEKGTQNQRQEGGESIMKASGKEHCRCMNSLACLRHI